MKYKKKLKKIIMVNLNSNLLHKIICKVKQK